MASICSAAPGYRPPLPAPGLRRPSSSSSRLGIPSFAILKLGSSLSYPLLTSRFNNAKSMQMTQRLSTALASSSNPSGGESAKDNSDGTTTPQDPPLATILAGLLVFLLICWIFGSIILWLFGLVVKVLPK